MERADLKIEKNSESLRIRWHISSHAQEDFALQFRRKILAAVRRQQSLNGVAQIVFEARMGMFEAELKIKAMGIHALIVGRELDKTSTVCPRHIHHTSHHMSADTLPAQVSTGAHRFNRRADHALLCELPA